jgi:hypothetical protein
MIDPIVKAILTMGGGPESFRYIDLISHVRTKLCFDCFSQMGKIKNFRIKPSSTLDSNLVGNPAEKPAVVLEFQRLF